MVKRILLGFLLVMSAMLFVGCSDDSKKGKIEKISEILDGKL